LSFYGYPFRCSVLSGIYYKRKVSVQMGKNIWITGKREWVGMGSGMKKKYIHE
jgi:hypothetical protein